MQIDTLSAASTGVLIVTKYLHWMHTCPTVWLQHAEVIGIDTTTRFIVLLLRIFVNFLLVLLALTCVTCVHM